MILSLAKSDSATSVMYLWLGIFHGFSNYWLSTSTKCDLFNILTQQGTMPFRYGSDYSLWLLTNFTGN